MLGDAGGKSSSRLQVLQQGCDATAASEDFSTMKRDRSCSVILKRNSITHAVLSQLSSDSSDKRWQLLSHPQFKLRDL